MGIQLRKKPQTCPNSREMKDELVIPAVEFSEFPQHFHSSNLPEFARNEGRISNTSCGIFRNFRKRWSRHSRDVIRWSHHSLDVIRRFSVYPVISKRVSECEHKNRIFFAHPRPLKVAPPRYRRVLCYFNNRRALNKHDDVSESWRANSGRLSNQYDCLLTLRQFHL